MRLKKPMRGQFLKHAIFALLLVGWSAQTGKAQQRAAAAPSVQADPDDTTNTAVDAKNGQYIRVWRSIMAPKDVADTFGHRIATHYIAMQITIANRNKDYQWLIQDAGIDVKRLLANQDTASCQTNRSLIFKALQNGVGTTAYTRVTSADLSILRGTAEKGQSLDPRNLTVKSLTGAGVIAAGLIGVMRLGHSYAPGVAAFNGALLSAVQEILPDYTVSQMNRLNDSAFLANTVVGKQQAKVLVIFVPQSDLLSKAQQKSYYSNPESVYPCTDLRLLEASVDGNFIANVTGAPVTTGVNIDSSEASKFAQDNFTVKGSVLGNFFAKATIDLVSPPDGLTVKVDGDPTDTAIKFIVTGTKPIPSNTVLEFAIKGTTGDPTHVSYRVDYVAAKPVVTSATPSPLTMAAGGTISIDLPGANFLPTGLTVELNPAKDVTPGVITFVSSTEIKFDLTANTGAAAGTRTLKINGPTGLSDTSLTLTVTQ